MAKLTTRSRRGRGGGDVMPGMDPATGRWTRDGDEIVVAVRRAFTTPNGARVMRRWLGFERAQLLDRPVEPGMLGPLTRAYAESLRAEPRVRLVRLAVDRAATSGGVGLAVEFRVRADAQIVRAAL